MWRLSFFIVIALGLPFLGCQKNPTDRLINPLNSGSVPQTSGAFVIFDDELKTGGGLGFIPGGGEQSITLEDRSGPKRSLNHIRYSWTGGDVFFDEFSVFQHDFAGFSLFITPELADLAAATGKDLSQAGYTTLRFSARGTLSAQTTLRIEGPDDGAGGLTAERLELTSATLGSDWQDYSLAIPASHFTSIKNFFTLTFQYAQPPRTTVPGNGGVVYLDDIRYTQ